MYSLLIIIFVIIVLVTMRNIYYIGYNNAKINEYNNQNQYMRETGGNLYDYYSYCNKKNFNKKNFNKN